MAQATVSLRFKKDFTDVKLVASTSSSLTNPIKSASYKTTNQTVKITLTGLANNTQYYYGVEISGVLQQGGRGQFKTFPISGQSANFTCAFGGDVLLWHWDGTVYPSNPVVFNNIKSFNPLFFVNLGDFFYGATNQNLPDRFRTDFDKSFQDSAQANFYSKVPTMYTWSEGDFGGRDSRATSRPAAQLVYKERVPHYPLPATNGAIYQSWVVGRVRFILLDLRSNATAYTSTDGASKTTLGATQIAWLKTELRKPEPLKILISDKPYIGTLATVPDSEKKDRWWDYATERKLIANFIKASNLEGRVALIGGDMHGLAIDDGTNADYADGGGAKMPVFQAAGPLYQGSSSKGGPWSEGKVLSSGTMTAGTAGNQFGLMNVTDNGSTLTVEWLGKRGTSTVLSYTFTVPGTTYVPPVGQ